MSVPNFVAFFLLSYKDGTRALPFGSGRKARDQQFRSKYPIIQCTVTYFVLAIHNTKIW